MDAYFVNSAIKKEEFEELEKYVLKHVSGEDFAGVRKNFKPTTNILEHSRDKAYWEGPVRETACPVQIRRSLEPLERRVPDVVGIGFAKCGTGTLQFLDCHPRVTMRSTEPKIYNSINTEIILKEMGYAATELDYLNFEAVKKEYLSKLPLVAKDEILIEKSPIYTEDDGNGQIEANAKAMKRINPNTKIIAIACDPIKRGYSMFQMEGRRTKIRLADHQNIKRCKACLHGTVNETIQEYTETISKEQYGPGTGFEEYVLGLRPFVDEFGAENVLLLDGENLIANPNEEWSRLLEFLGLEKDSLKFYHDKEKGFPCLESPLKYCLNGAKGISRKEDVRQLYPKETEIWRKAFSPKIKELISYMKICDKIDRKCCRKLKKEATSFSWAYEYAC
ncbi:Oidioi.mRNA.OKI2018_I69.chr1.g2090.t1.cds [Oikopleura dioica]|uniref:Sulfotransferase n=1 Tax=Oikopleura dioica TaxID=34765 RepID=A0ABN7SZ38_OIKDI|nr:Oidioi.mRNA.OKI2018_I69.chr1.g2090.t1.cds [Oikopleura dioica]